MMNELAPGTFAGLAQEEVDLFRKVLKGVKGIGVEIGCLDGFSSRVILEASELHLTSIDPFIPDSMEASLIGSKEKYLHNVAPWKDRATLIEDYSYNAVSTHYTPGPDLDFLFIDGDHTYDWVHYDFTMFTPMIKKGGLVAMHDARMSRPDGARFHEGPSRIALEHLYRQPETWEIVGEAFSLVIARRR